MALVDERVWLQTSGMSAPWQAMAGSDASNVAVWHQRTALEAYPLFMPVILPQVLTHPASDIKVESPPVRIEQLRLCDGIVSLLRFRLEPDEPVEDDIAYRPLDRFPD